MVVLKATDLCKTYIVNKRQNNVLRNVEVEIGDGDMVAVMGPSGDCGIIVTGRTNPVKSRVCEA